MERLPRWHYDEMKPVGVDYSDISEVRSYDTRMSRIRDVKKECEGIIDTLNLPSSSSILEIGTGTGAFAIEAARRFGRVIAVDVSPAMLEFARSRAREENIKNIEFHQAGFLTFRSPGLLFNAVVSQIALHHLPDFWKLIALKRIHRMLKPGGKLYLRDIVFSFDIESYQVFFDRWVEELKRAAGEEIARDTETSIRDEFYTLDWIMEGLLTRAGFAIKSTEYTDGFMAVYLCEKQP
ncbi:MAG: methyltransferase domain-containing protein [Syntrophomonadaceae bacterium]|nr:methyltransferase domain-containing protein [Syntrophomonadaceae bacterium]